MSKGTLLFNLVAFRRCVQNQTVRTWTVSQLLKGHVERRRLVRNAPCAKAARQRVSTEYVHRRSTFASMRNTDSESDAESDADTESVNESADSVVWGAVKPNARLRTPSHLETCQTMLVEYGNLVGDG